MISWYDNIPLFSYIVLGGKCRNCKKKISLRYPLIEFFTALGFLAISFYYYPDISFIIYFLIIYSLLILIFVIDIEHQIIPDSLVFFGLIFVLLVSLFSSEISIFNSIFAGFLASSFLMLIHLLTKGKGMGLGDVKFAVFGGFFTGFPLFLVWLFASFLTGGVVGLILILGRQAGLKDKIAFGPFLVVGLILTVFFGSSFIKFLGF